MWFGCFRPVKPWHKTISQSASVIDGCSVTATEHNERLIEILTADRGLQVNRNGKSPKRLKNLDPEMVVVYDQINFRSHFITRREGSWYQLARIQYQKRKNGKVRATTYIYPGDQLFVPKQMRVEKKVDYFRSTVSPPKS
ncbi:hypothetical protein CMK14_01900 [Candidatus Poribacteria bacterium]|nr:hypothetical protein [Candidatus Poribacteria bacterium]